MKKKLLSLVALVTMATSFAQYTTQNAGIPVQSAGVRDFHVINTDVAWVHFYDGSANQTYPRYVGVTSNGGDNWTTRLVSNIPTSGMISDLYGFDANKAFIVTAPISGSTANGLWKTTNGGDSWTKQTGVFSSASFGNIVHFFNNTNGLVIGDPVNNKYEMYKTTDGGNTWTTLTTAPVPLTAEEYGYVGGRASFGEHLWLTSNTGRILHTANQGATWDSYFAPIDDFAGADSNGTMAFSSATYGLLVDNNGWLWYTEDGGESWDIKDAVNYYNGDVKYIPGTTNSFVTTGISTASTLGLGTAYSTDGGDTWENIDSEQQRGSIGVLNSSTMYVGQFTSDNLGNGGILKLDFPLAANDLSTVKNVELKAVVNNKTLNIVSNKEIKTTTIADTTGRKLAETKGKTISVSNLKQGIYIARVAYADGAFGTVKFVVK